MDSVRSGSLFGQILSIIDRKRFERLVAEHKTDRGAKGLRSWDQMVAMLFCHMAQARSLREISTGLLCCEGKLRHLGMEKSPGRSTLSYANAHRDWKLYRALFYELFGQCRQVAPRHRFAFKNKLLSLDATIIELCASAFDWAKFRAGKGAVKLHVMLDHDGYLPCFAHITEGAQHELKVAQNLELPKGAIVAMDRGYNDYHLFEKWTKQGVYFVTRLKDNASYFSTKKLFSATTGFIRRDELIEFEVFTAGRKIKETYRRVEVWLEDKQEIMVLLTNHLTLSPLTIAAIYKERWQIELFFKTLKQNLRLKTFVGTSANAVHIQIWTALIALLLTQFLKLKSSFSWALSNLVALLRWNLFTYRNLWKWLNAPFDTPPLNQDLEQLTFVLDSSPP